MGRQKTQERIADLTPELAKEFSTMEPIPQDRKFKRRNFETLKSAMSSGEFEGNYLVKALCLETGKEHRANGKHTSLALLAVADALKSWPTVTVCEYICDKLKDVAELYAAYDTGLSKRTPGDVIKALTASSPELSAVPEKILSVGVSGISYEMWGGSYGARPPKDRANQAIKYPKFFLWLESITRGQKDTALLLRSPVVSAMFKTWKVAPLSANTQFWTAVRKGTGEDPDMPQRQVNRMLVELRRSREERRKQTKSEVMDPHELMAKCLHGWNAWRTGKPTKLRYYKGHKTPEAV